MLLVPLAYSGLAATLSGAAGVALVGLGQPAVSMAAPPSLSPPPSIEPPADLRPRAGGAQTIVRSADGLFYVDARINGRAVRFLVDTGSNVVVLTRRDAERAGVATTTSVAAMATAAGPAEMRPATLAMVEVAGRKEKAVRAVVMTGDDGISLMGQSMLSRLSSFSIEGDALTLE